MVVSGYSNFSHPNPTEVGPKQAGWKPTKNPGTEAKTDPGFENKRLKIKYSQRNSKNKKLQ